MTERNGTLDARARPPDVATTTFKKYKKLKGPLLEDDDEILDVERGPSKFHTAKLKIIKEYPPEQLRDIFSQFEGTSNPLEPPVYPTRSISVYEHQDCPGLYIIPSLIPLSTQAQLLSRLLHRDLSNPKHLTNIHMHYEVDYPPTGSSFFSVPFESPHPCTPKDPNVHSSISIQSFLDRKLRWMTLGGQYDWTNKVYPSTPPPPFPPDIADLLHGLFPDMRSEAAICNLYTPGDTLSMHRDVSEFCNAPLVSISIGCDAIFVVKPSQPEEHEKDKPPLVLRLRSGDALYMSGSSRFAWHGVPQVVPDTCPAALVDWPAGVDTADDEFAQWRGWMRRKRINLNVRQMNT